MSVNHASMTTHPSQSLPSFAQAFSNRSLSSMASANNALPPIHPRISPMDQPQRSPPARSLSRPGSEEDPSARTAGRKRPHTDIVQSSRDDAPPEPDRASPNTVRIKEEHDQDMLEVSPPPQDSRSGLPPQDATGAPAPSSTMPSPMKRRRMTVTGAPHALNIDVRIPPAEANSTPISPVVMGFTIQRDNLKEIEQVKSMITVKQKQKALIEQRRGSLAGPPAANSVGPPPTSGDSSSNSKGPVGPLRPSRRSPNGGAGSRRTATSISGANRAPSPNPSTFQMQQSVQLPHQSAQTLPPPPISFARRRAAQLGTKRKPADIMINPRESPEQFQPSIQSAPPTQGAFYSGRYPMALPRLPNVMNSAETSRRPTGHVPPTPTRLSQRMSNSANPPSIHIEGTRSPMPSIAIASSLVPPTPAFHQTEHSASGGDKAAFLAPFAQFYDALNDSKQLKTWLGEQLQRANSLCQNLAQQQDNFQESVESIVDRKMSNMHSEMTSLRRRVLELEEALREANGRRGSIDVGSLYHTKSLQNGYPSSSHPSSSHPSSDSYTFPQSSSDHSRIRSDMSGRVSSPRGHERDGRGMYEMERDSSVPFDSRRTPASALRLEPPRSHHDPSSLPPPPSHSRIPHSMQSPPPIYRDSPPIHSLQPPNSHGKSSSSRGGSERPPMARRSSHGDRDREREHENSMPRRSGSRRNSIVMSPPDQRIDES